MALAAALVTLYGPGGEAAAQPGSDPIGLVVPAGTPLRIALELRIRIKRVGQPVSGVLVDPVYRYDRIVIPAATRVSGRVKELRKVTGGARAAALLNGDFTPPRPVVLSFDSLALPDGTVMSMETSVGSGTDHVAVSVSARKGLAAKAVGAVAEPAREVASTIKRPGWLGRFKQALVARLPLHPQYLRPGTVFTAVLQSPLDFGVGEAAEMAPEGTAPHPESILQARLVTAVDSRRTPRGSVVRAMVTRPVFSDDHRLILPEGTLLTGEVTFAKAARRLRRNGQLRFLFETVQVPERGPESMRASLHSVQAGRDQRVALDDEGGAAVTNSKGRFMAPALASVAFGLTLRRTLDYDTDGAGPEPQYGSTESRGIGGFFGYGLIGTGLSQLSRPLATGVGALGVARTIYVGVFGKGRDVTFPEHTVIEVQLAPGPGPEK